MAEPISGGYQENVRPNRPNDLHGFDLSPNDIARLLSHCLDNNCFCFGQSKQRLGIAMGCKVAPPVAIIFMHRLEQTALQNAPLKPDMYARYIDDTVGVWTHSHQELQDLFNYMNTIHPSIKFTIEDSHTSGSIPYLDTLLSVDKDSKYSTELFIKPSHSGIIIHYSSSQPMATKKSVIRNEFKRARKLSSNEEAASRSRSCDKIQNVFESNGYPKQMIRRMRRETSSHPQQRQRHHRHQPRHTQHRWQQQQARQDPDGYLSLPYVDETLCAKINSITKKSGMDIKVAWTSRNTLKSKLVKSDIARPECPSGRRTCNACSSGVNGKCTMSGVVYCITCNQCTSDGDPVTYVGECKRPIRLRFNEHVLNAKNSSPDTPFGDHFRSHHAGETLPDHPLSVRILHRAKDHPNRKIMESLYIRQLKPVLNRNTSSWFVLQA